MHVSDPRCCLFLILSTTLQRSDAWSELAIIASTFLLTSFFFKITFKLCIHFYDDNNLDYQRFNLITASHMNIKYYSITNAIVAEILLILTFVN